LNFRAVLLTGVSLFACAVAAKADCNRPELKNQSHNDETIQRLERAWSVAYVSGDTEFEACLLAADFMEIRSDGNIHKLADELALAAKNKGQTPKPVSNIPITVHLHGDVAVAYGVSSTTKVVDGKPYKSYFADYYVWKDGAWHVFFAEQTSFKVADEATTPSN
jgi:Domain of unknown function (DUF4440)